MNKIKGLDGLRAIAVLLVIASHVQFYMRAGIPDPITRVFTSINGVTVFFVLSGFLITMLLLREQENNGSISIKNFFARRTLRIFPLYFLAISVVPIVQLLGYVELKSCTYLYAYTYLFNFVPNECRYQAYGHFWSLAVEEHFYLLWPFIFVLGKRIGIAVMLIFIYLAGVYGTSFFSEYYSTHVVHRWSFPAGAPIAFGCLAAYFCESKLGKRLMSSEFKKLHYTMFIAAFILLFKNYYGAHSYVFNLGATLIILFVYARQDSAFVRILEIKPLAYLGTISYGLYVWQGIFTGNGPARQFPHFPPSMDIGLLLTFIIAPLSYHFFEKPILRLKNKFPGANRSQPRTNDTISTLAKIKVTN